MHRSIILTFLLAAACTRPFPSLDDEAGVTTNFGEEDSTDEDSTDDAALEGDSTGMVSTTSTEDTSDSGDDFMFIEIGDILCNLQCDVFNQDCPQGEKCVPYASSGGGWDSNKCVPVLGDAQPGDACMSDGIVEATDDCDASSICWGGVCTAFCSGTVDEPQCSLGSSCLNTGEGSATLCVNDCDPLLQDCDAGHACYWADVDFGCVPTIADILLGEPCGYINDCAPGNSCTDAELVPGCMGAACCASFCDLESGDSDCSASPGTACVPFLEDGEEVGLCVAL